MSSLKVGSECKTGQKVSEILGQSSVACVFFTEDEGIRWEYYDNDERVPSEMLPAIIKFDSLLRQIKSNIPKNSRRPYYEQLLKALFACLDGKDPESIDGFFKPVAEILRRIRYAPIYYSLSGVLFTFILALLIHYHPFVSIDIESQPFFTAAFFGVLGSGLSILQRGRQIWTEPETERLAIVLQGAIRSIIGIFFGVLTFLFIEAEIIATLIKDNVMAVHAITFVAGFSERFIPEISSMVERDQLK